MHSLPWQASWIWHPPGVKQENLYLHFRNVLPLDAAPAVATVRVTAGSLYILWINGQPVGRGPNPADPSYYYFDEYDVARFLKPGANVIAATCFMYTEKPAGIIKQNWGPGGFLFELRDKDHVIAGSDASWRVIHAPEWDPSAPVNNTLYWDFKEYYDVRKELPGWRDDPAFDDAAWHPASELGVPPAGPYPNLHPREIPFLTADRLLPQNVFWDSASVNYAWRDDWEIYHERSLLQPPPWKPGTKPMEVKQTHPDFPPSVLFDFGHDVTGYPEISIRDGSGGVLDLLYGEDLSLVRVDTFTLKPGPQTLRPFNRRTFRYLKLVFRSLPTRLLVDGVSIEQSTYPVDYAASAFTCSDDLLNRIYDVSKRTIHLSMLDHYVDCPWRERSIYGGDLYVEALFGFYAFGDTALARKTIRQMFAIQYPCGAIPPVGPYSGFDHFYPAWTAFTALALIDDYRLTADETLIREMCPALEKLMDWVVGQLSEGEIFLIGEPERGGDIDAWMAAPKVKYDGWSNFPFRLLLMRMSIVAHMLEIPTKPYHQHAEKMRKAIQSHLVAEDGTFAPWPRSAVSGQAPAYNNGLLAWGGGLDMEARERAIAPALADQMPRLGAGFQEGFLVEAAFHRGLFDAGLARLRREWGDALARGATTFWEYHYPDSNPAFRENRGGSLCHGWSAWPIYLLPNYILGIQPGGRGFKKIKIDPHPANLTRASGHLDTPQGQVYVSWQVDGPRFRLTGRFPRGSSVDFDLPGTPNQRVTLNGIAVDTRRHSRRLYFSADVESADVEVQ